MATGLPPPQTPATTSESSDRAGVRAVLYALLGFIVGLAAMVFALKILNPRLFDSGSEVTGAQSPQMADAGMDIYQVLEHHIPDAINSCVHIPRTTLLAQGIDSSVYAADSCDAPSEHILNVQYYSFHDGVAVRKMFDARMQTVPQRVREDCTANSASELRWRSPPPQDSQAGNVVHMSVNEAISMGANEGISMGGGSDPEVTGGMALCWVHSDGQHEIDWYDSDTHIFAVATASLENQDALHRWWRNDAGPFHPTGAMSEDPQAMPSASPSPSMSSSMP